MQREHTIVTRISRLKMIVALSALAFAALALAGCSKSNSLTIDVAEQGIVSALTESLNESLNHEKQAMFNRINPMGQMGLSLLYP